MPLMTIRWLGISAPDNVRGKRKIAKRGPWTTRALCRPERVRKCRDAKHSNNAREGALNNPSLALGAGKRDVGVFSGRGGGHYKIVALRENLWRPPPRPHIHRTPETPRRARGWIGARAFARGRTIRTQISSPAASRRSCGGRRS